jgi:hypothetical protein
MFCSTLGAGVPIHGPPMGGGGPAAGTTTVGDAVAPLPSDVMPRSAGGWLNISLVAVAVAVAAAAVVSVVDDAVDVVVVDADVDVVDGGKLVVTSLTSSFDEEDERM